MPKVSVIIPVYKVEDFIARCAESLFAQTLDGIEFVFVDDCTPDRSMDILQSVIDANRERMEEKGWSVVMEHMPVNSGLPAVRRRGIERSTGDYIIHCDSDDWPEPQMYGLMYEAAVRNDADIVICDFAVNDGASVIEKVKGAGTTDKDRFIRDLLLQKYSWAVWNKLVSRRCFTDGLIPPKGNMGEDMVQTFQLLLNAGSVAYVPQTLYNYFLNTASMTNSRDDETMMRYFRQRMENADIVYDVLKRNGLEEKYADEIVAHKLFIKSRIRRTQFNGHKRRIWKDTYREINGRVLSNPSIPLAEKIKFVGTYLGIYPYRR